MELQEILGRFDGVKRCNEDQYMARCPCHDDKKQSLSIGRGRKGVVLKCQAGCDTRDILARVGLQAQDLFYNKPQQRKRIVATYDYPNGVQKLRYSDKSFSWRRPNGKGGWIWNRQGVKSSLYIAGELEGVIAVTEGEKDANNLHRLGWNAVSGEDGAGPGKWKAAYTEQLKGLTVCIFQDNDNVGKAYAQETAAALHGNAARVCVLDLSQVWPEMPEHGDVSDLIVKFGDEKACELIAGLISTAKEWDKPMPKKGTAESAGLAELHPENNPRYGWNDIGNGNLFADWYQNIARYAPKRKKWFVYNGKVWRPDSGNLRAMELCKKLADELVIYALSLPDGGKKDEYRRFVERWQKRYNRETILKDAASVYPVDMEEFDKDPYLYNCKNGTIDLRIRSFRPHSPDDMLTMIAGVKYDPEARSPLWEKVISDAMEGDNGKITYLQKSMGYGLTGDNSEECFFIFYGATTRNGKGTTMETYMRMQGDYGRTASPETLAQKQKLQKNGNAPSEDIARLAGARVVNISEPDQNLVLSASLVKALTGSDKITARFLNEGSFEFYPQFKFYINTNYLPKLTDVTVFNSGRVKVIPFERHFTEQEQDKGLKKKLAKAENLSGVLNWCLEGLRLAQETGFEPPPAVLKATAEYQQASDKISRFIADELEAGYDYEVRTAEVYARYQEWCQKNGHGFAESITKWKEKMDRVVVIKPKRPKAGGAPTPMILGYRLQPKIAPFI